MIEPRLEDIPNQMNLRVCRIQPSLSRADRNSQQTGTSSQKPPSGLTLIAFLLLVSGAMNLAYSALDITAAIAAGNGLRIAFELGIIGLGIIMIFSGWGLGNWKQWGLLGAIVSNILLAAFSTLGVILDLDPTSPFYISSDPIYAIISIATSLIIIFYLVRPEIRHKFD
jgi:hypothetical protein